MQHRKWFLVVAIAMLVHAFLVIRVSFVIAILPTYGDADIRACTNVAIACGLIWLVLEVFERWGARRPMRCSCGYRLAGLKCPECGKPLSE